MGLENEEGMTPEQVAAGRVALDAHIERIIGQASFFERGPLRTFLTEDLRNQFVIEVGNAILGVKNES